MNIKKKRLPNKVFSELVKSSINKKRQSEYLVFIDDLILNNQYKEALKVITKAKNQYPENLQFLNKEADIHFQRENYKKAFVIYEVLEIEANKAKKNLCLAIQLINQDLVDQAMPLINSLIKIKENEISSRAYSLLADIAFINNDYKSMYRWAREALKRNAFLDSLVDKFFLSIVLTDYYKKSIPFFEKVLDENPYSDKAWLCAGKTYRKAGFDLKAIECFELACDTNPKLVEAENLLTETRGY